MSSRSSNSARKTRERYQLVYIIARDRVDADIPYTYCFKNKKPYYFNNRLSKYSEYVRCGRSYDRTFVVSLRE
jgi:hypothetical protein